MSLQNRFYRGYNRAEIRAIIRRRVTDELLNSPQENLFVISKNECFLPTADAHSPTLISNWEVFWYNFFYDADLKMDVRR